MCKKYSKLIHINNNYNINNIFTTQKQNIMKNRQSSRKSINFYFSRFASLFEKKKAELLKISKSKKIELKRPTNADLIIAILISESRSVKQGNAEYYKMKKKKMLKILKKNKKELIDNLQKKKKHKGLKSSDKKKKLVDLLITYESRVVKAKEDIDSSAIVEEAKEQSISPEPLESLARVDDKENEEEQKLESLEAKEQSISPEPAETMPEESPAASIEESLLTLADGDYSSMLTKTPGPVKGLIFNYLNEITEEEREWNDYIFTELSNTVDDVIDRLGGDDEYIDCKDEIYFIFKSVLSDILDEVPEHEDEYEELLELVDLLPRSIPVDDKERKEVIDSVWKNYEKKYFKFIA